MPASKVRTRCHGAGGAGGADTGDCVRGPGTTGVVSAEYTPKDANRRR